MHWVAVAIVFSALILVHEFGHFWMARRVGVKVEIFSFGFGPKLFSFKMGDCEYRISAILFGGYVKMAGDEPSEERKGELWEFLSQPVVNRLKIVFAGILLNYILGFAIFSSVFYIGYPVTTKIGSVVEGYPAAEKEIKAGDKIIALDGRAVRNWAMVMDTIKRRTKGPLSVTLKRGDSIITVNLTAKVEEGRDLFGNLVKVGRIGIVQSRDIEYEKFGVLESLKLGFDELMWVTKLTYQALWSMATLKTSFKEVAGPVGIVGITAAAAKSGISLLLYITALITASLAIFNLLPIPVLDGGHILFLIIEKLRGKPLSRRAQEIATQAGLAFLIALMFFATYNDISRYFKK